MNARPSRIAAGAAVLLGLLSLASCQQFFTSSLAKALARNSYSIPSDMSVSDASDWLDIAIANNNEELAAALVAPLLAAATAADPASDAYDEAASALGTAVLLSSGASPAIIGVVQDIGIDNFASLTDLSPESEALIDEALDSLATISLSQSETDALLLIAANGAPDGLSSDDLYIAALSLAIDAFGDAGISLTTLTDLSDSLNDATIPGTDDDAAIAGALALLAMAQDLDALDSTESMLGQLLGGLSFETP